MTNFPKNNYSKKNSNRGKRNSQSKNFNNSNNFKEDGRFLSENNKFKRNKPDKRHDFKNNESNRLSSNNLKINKFNKSQNRNYLSGANKEMFSENGFKKNQLSINPNDKNFDDWIWGKHSVFEALSNNRNINRIWCTPDIFSSEKFFLLFKEIKSKGVLIEEVTWNRLSQLTLGAVHQGVALQLASSQTVSLKNLIDNSCSKFLNPIIVALDGITDPHNLGAIIRSAEAFDCKGIIIPQRRSAGLTGTVAKVAAGALEHIPVSRVVNLNRAIDELKKNGFLAVGLSGNGQVPISEFKEKAPLVVIVGSENKGISLLTEKNCNYLVKIPLRGKSSSLNASVAAAISLCYLSQN